MNRRAFVGLVALFSGCSARLPLSDVRDPDGLNYEAPTSPPPQFTNVTQPETPAPTAPSQQGDTPSTEPVEEPAPEPVEEPVAEPVEEPASESGEEKQLTDRERRGLTYLESTERRLDVVIAAFTDGYGSELTDVTASSVDFLKSDYAIQVALAEAQKRYINSSKAAANAEQERTAERLIRMWRFLRDATRTQRAIIECYIELEDVHTAFEENNSKVALLSIESLKETRWVAEREHRNVVDSSSVGDVDAIDSITAEEYEGKVAQFAADIALYHELDDVLREYTDGVKWLARAKREFYEEPRRISQARDSAKDARNHLRSARRQLDQVRKNAEDGATIVATIDELRDLAKSQFDEAQEIIRS